MYTLHCKIALLLVLIGAINWGLIGAFDLNIVNILNNQTIMSERVERGIYILVGVAALYLAWTHLTSKGKWVEESRLE